MSKVDDLGAALFGERWRVWAGRRAAVVASNALVVGQRAKIAGVARVAEQVGTAPFTQRPALAWLTLLEEKHLVDHPPGFATMHMGTTWETKVQERWSQTFLLEDEHGSVLIDARHAIVALPMTDVGDHPKVNDDNALFREYLHTRGIQSGLYLGAAGQYRFHEAVLSPGDRVAVWGKVGETTGVAAMGYRDAATRTLVVAGTPADPCVLTVTTRRSD